MYAFIFPVLTTLSVERVLPHEAGQLLGVNSAISSLMNIFGPLFAGFIYDYFMAGSPFWMGALILFLTAYMLFRTVQGVSGEENLQAVSY